MYYLTGTWRLILVIKTALIPDNMTQHCNTA